MKDNPTAAGVWHRMWQRTEIGSPEGHRVAISNLQELVNSAHREWQVAEEYFQTVSDPALVDYAIYCMEAAKRKYIYLFRQLRHSHGYPTETKGTPWT